MTELWWGLPWPVDKDGKPYPKDDGDVPFEEVDTSPGSHYDRIMHGIFDKKRRRP